MPSTYTPLLNIEKPAAGEQNNTWGTTLNAGFDKIDAAMGWVKINQIDITSAAVVPSVTLTLPTVFNRFRVVWQGLAASTNGTLYMQVSNASGQPLSFVGVLDFTVYSIPLTTTTPSNGLLPFSGTTGVTLSPESGVGPQFGSFEFEASVNMTGTGRCQGIPYASGGYTYLDTAEIVSNSYPPNGVPTNAVLSFGPSTTIVAGHIALLGMAF